MSRLLILMLFAAWCAVSFTSCTEKEMYPNNCKPALELYGYRVMECEYYGRTCLIQPGGGIWCEVVKR